MDDPILVPGDHRKDLGARLWEPQRYSSSLVRWQCIKLLVAAAAALGLAILVGESVAIKTALIGLAGIALSVPFRKNLRFLALSISFYIVNFSIFHNIENGSILAFSFVPLFMLLYARESTR